MRKTMKDVALMAGVSIKTVSRIINNEFNGKSAIQDKVQQAIKQLNFHPSKAAQRLAGNKAFSIGLAYHNPNAYYVVDLQEGLLNCCNQQGHELFILPCALLPNSSNNNSNAQYVLEQAFINLVIRSQLSGVVLTPPYSENAYIKTKLLERHIPFVAIVSGKLEARVINEQEHINYIFLNDEKAAEQINCHLLQSGHQRIAYIGGNINHDSSKNRRLGYQQALTSYGLEQDEQLIFEGEFSFAFGVQSAKKLLQLSQPPSAIFAGNDEIAAGAIFAAQQLGIQVPEQLSIVGFENSPFSRQTFPALTTLNIPTVKMANKAGKMLIDKLNGVETVIKSIEFDPKIILRESSGLGPMKMEQSA